MTRRKMLAASTRAFQTALECGMTIEDAEAVSYRVYRALAEMQERVA